jgi:proteasome lid subunit RPN8/RPN11
MVELEEFSTSIILSGNLWRSMLADVQLRAPEEACGLLGGKANRVFAVVPITNRAKSSTRFRMEPTEQLRAFQRFEALGLEITCIYHSHPAGPATPSPTDIVEAYYPEAAYLIWSRYNEDWECRAYRMDNGSFFEIDIRMIDD